MVRTRTWILSNRPKETPTYSGPDATFTLMERDLQPLQPGQILVKVLFFSNDPAQRTWIKSSDDLPSDRHYVKPVDLNTPMQSRGLCEVIESRSDALPMGTTILARVNWNEYAVLDAKDATPLSPLPNGLSFSHYLGVFGTTGLTAYYGTVVVGEAKASHRLVVSGAAGATGSMVVQIAKRIIGVSEVIGIAGSDDKCKFVVETLGADKCLNYRSPSFFNDLTKATEDCVDIYFDNVGGTILDAMLGRLKQNGVVVACGSISGYNSDQGTLLTNYFQVISMRLQIRGFIAADYVHKAQEVTEIFIRALEQGKLTINDELEHVVPTTFEDVPKTWLKLFDGSNTGKLVTKIIP
ncbi:quinone oxidoreductase [Exophiala xenobiotica]|nr:quinone oxidoreductase [Exophiala xenobiotica]KAK5549369.1 quinone oxidoreductase [Chaetothyriales sp. CCFEE 6169]KAK5247254.1 quinone oxidoreductase [Exophiala xenobiotica]KAK5297402.1 quinone oxidoreductase [Exophiala xenobiotica]KAK5302831.1 quinone oxidoreductase [Exophiala xenobiotica]